MTLVFAGILVVFCATAQSTKKGDFSSLGKRRFTFNCDLTTNKGCLLTTEECKPFVPGSHITHCVCKDGYKKSSSTRKCVRVEPTLSSNEEMADFLQDKSALHKIACDPRSLEPSCGENAYCSSTKRLCICYFGSDDKSNCIAKMPLTNAKSGRKLTEIATATVESPTTDGMKRFFGATAKPNQFISPTTVTTSPTAVATDSPLDKTFLNDLNSLIDSMNEEEMTKATTRQTIATTESSSATASFTTNAGTTTPLKMTLPSTRTTSRAPTVPLTSMTTRAPLGTTAPSPSTGAMTQSLSKTAAPSTQALLKTTLPLSPSKSTGLKPLVVSAGNNREMYLPQSSIVLHANMWPPKSDESYYQFEWSKISGPDGGTIANSHAAAVTLSQLKAGTYSFKVVVTGKNHEYGVASVNVTVHEPKKPNRPPKARIAPNDGELEITLPVDTVVLDAKQSTDDTPGLTYLWEQVQSPLQDEANRIAPSHVATLRLTNLKAGNYKYKLTVTDSDGATDVAYASITVKPEVDYPPIANSGDSIIIKLPIDSATLNGNKSTDDKGIVSYLWEKSADSPSQGDMQGTTSSILHLTHLAEGVYTFTLVVTDTAGQTGSSKVFVVVKPENNFPPKVDAGPDKELVYPNLDSTTLDGRKTTDDMGQGDLKVHWELESFTGPEGPESGSKTFKMSDPDKFVLHLSQLRLGTYVFKLTATDKQGAQGSDTVTVNVKEVTNQSPIANAGADVVIRWPNRAAELDGSQSSDDMKIVSYLWEKTTDSPYIGDTVNGSDRSPILRVYNLVPGDYTFKLTVADEKGKTTSDTATIHLIRELKHKNDLIEVSIKIDPSSFSVSALEGFKLAMSYELDIDKDRFVIETVDGEEDRVFIEFYVLNNEKSPPILPPLPIAKQLQKKISQSQKVFHFDVEFVDTVVCQETCSGHGKCNVTTKRCVCDSFWVENPFKANFGMKETNCDWSLVYVVVVAVVLGLILLVVLWACICLLRGKRIRARRRLRYALLSDKDDDSEMVPLSTLSKKKSQNGSLMMSESFSEEEILFDSAKKLLPEKKQKGGSLLKNNKANGLVKKK